jgi:hypothetical protein
VRLAITKETARGMLPIADRQSIEAIETLIQASAKKQWKGEGAESIRRSDGRHHKDTVSVQGALALSRTVDDFLRFAASQEKWRPFTLSKLLTPKRVTRFFYYAARYDGGGLSHHTVKNRETKLLNFFKRGRLAQPDPVVVVTSEQEEAIRKLMADEQQNRGQWNLSPCSLSNTGKAKFYPLLEQVAFAIAALEEQIVRADEAHVRGFISDEAHWRAVRDATMTLCTIYCMWRVDTVGTISLSHLRKDPATGSVVDGNGFVVVEKIARAKDSTGQWYPFVPELTLPPNAVRLIEQLLELEGRSLARPLKPGEEAVHLSADKGDRWGHDPVMDGELIVVPLFRMNPDRPEGPSYEAIQAVLRKQLERLQFGATNPHTLRATGAIYWTYIQEMPEELVMMLGLWQSANELRENYAHIGLQDKRARMARFVPMGPTATLEKPRGRREQAAAAALTVLSKLLEKTTSPHEARRHLLELHRHYQEIDKTIASELGKHWEPMRLDRLEPGELERLDAALTGAGYERGIKGVLGRDLFASDALRSIAEATAAGSTPPKQLRRFKAALQLPAGPLALPPVQTPTAAPLAAPAPNAAP